MARQDVNITQCSDGLSPKATSRYPLGDRPSLSGGTAALEWITNGNLAHGDLITVRTNVAGLFGESDDRSQSLRLHRFRQAVWTRSAHLVQLGKSERR